METNPEAGQSTSTEPRDCLRPTGDQQDIDTGSNSRNALALSGELFVCADDVVVVGGADINEVAVAAQLAAALGSPLLLPDDRLPAELGRLGPLRVHAIGNVAPIVPPETELIPLSMSEAVDAAASALSVSTRIDLPASPDASTVVETVSAIASGDRVVSASPASADAAVDVAVVVSGLLDFPAETSAVWIVDGTDPVATLLAAGSGKAVEASPIAIDAANPLSEPAVGEVISSTAWTSRFIGPSRPGDWELAVMTNDAQLPGGGYLILPEEQRRYVAFYGHPETNALGVLGEQAGDATIQRMEPFLTAYSGDGAQVVPTFEIIATVASAGAGDDGNYSYEWPIETFDDLLETAVRHDAYVLLDIQPGRSDFLTQSMVYEELLLQPHIGLALDPEWRLKPDQVHLEQVGTVDAAEVNTVIEWLADLVHDNGLPQKMLLLHMFRTEMITNREILIDRPELQLVIQMDGDGREVAKDNTWGRLMEGFEDAFWEWGWKNFFDEDEPGPPTPESTMAKEPSPVYVSYQ